MINEKTLVFGGSFDPPHKYHANIVKKAIKTIKPDKIIIVPTYISPFKNGHCADYIHRKEMLKIIIKKNKIKAYIDDFEYKRGKRTYTYQLAKYLKRKYKKSELYFLLGSDSYNSLEKWKRYEEIKRTFKFAVAVREGHEIKKTIVENAVILKGRFKNLSSTEIRNRLFCGDYSLIDKEIKKYILNKGLYFSNIIREIKKLQTKKRFKHSLYVTKLALELSRIYKADTLKAVLAALLHDATKDMKLRKQLEFLKKSDIKVKKLSNVIKYFPEILHQWSAAAYSKIKFNIEDKKILSAIKKHTTGDKNMSLLDKIIYVSDIAAEDRNFKEADIIKELAKKDINKAYEKAKRIKENFVKMKKQKLYE